MFVTTYHIMHHPFLRDQILKMASALTAAELCLLFYSGVISSAMKIINKKNARKLLVWNIIIDDIAKCLIFHHNLSMLSFLRTWFLEKSEKKNCNLQAFVIIKFKLITKEHEIFEANTWPIPSEQHCLCRSRHTWHDTRRRHCTPRWIKRKK